MNLDEIYQLRDEVAQIQATYQLFNEDSRLNHSRAARVEFINTTRYIEKYLKPGMKILDVGAGAGEYSLYFARSGFEVSALELTDSNIAAFRKKLLPEGAIRILITADLETIKARFAQRMRGNLPAPVAMMLEKKHGCFDNEKHDFQVISGETDMDSLCAEILKMGRI